MIESECAMKGCVSFSAHREGSLKLVFEGDFNAPEVISSENAISVKAFHDGLKPGSGLCFRVLRLRIPDCLLLLHDGRPLANHFGTRDRQIVFGLSPLQFLNGSIQTD